MSDELLRCRVIIERSKKEVTEELVQKQITKELSDLGNATLVYYKVEDFVLLSFKTENDPDDSYYLPASSVLVYYFLDPY